MYTWKHILEDKKAKLKLLRAAFEYHEKRINEMSHEEYMRFKEERRERLKDV